MRLFDLKIGPRVALAFGAVVLTIAVMVLIVMVSLWRSATNSVGMGQGMQLQSQAAETHLMAKDNAIAGMVILVSSSEDQQARLRREIEARDARIDKNLGVIEAASAGQAEDAALIAEIRKRHATYRAGVKRIVDMVLAGKQAEAAFAADEEMIPMLAPFLDGLAKLDALQVARVRSTEQANGQLIANTQTLTLATGLAAVLIAVLAGVLVVRSVKRPLAQALSLAERVAAGDLSTQVQAGGHDEVSLLVVALNNMSGSLAHIVQRVRDVADGVATGSDEIATGNADLSQRTEHQASTLQQTAASMEELGSTVSHNADHARHANDLARGASTVAVRGGEVVGQVIATMKGIDQSSKRIADIIGVIDGIAFQTNILALNAAVEAARAGEQGRGFAVVASEVRSLAQRSANAAKEIKGLISASVEQVQAGTQLVDRAGVTMQEVVAAIGQVSSIMDEINTASGQQQAGVAQIGQAVTQLDGATQQNAALVEESAAAAESLRRQAQQLVHTVAAFKLA